MNKAQLVDALTARIGDRRTAASAVDGLLEIIVETVSSGGSVTLTGFGVFETRARAARVARNPRTGETVPVAATTVPAFRPGTAFKALVSGTVSDSAGGSQVNGTPTRSAVRRPRPAARATAAAAAPNAAPEVAAPAGAARATRSFSAPEEVPVKPAKARKAKAAKDGDKGVDKDKGDKGKSGKPAKKAKGRK